MPRTPARPLRVATLLPNIHVTGPEVRMTNFALAADPSVVDFEFIVIGHSRKRERNHGSLRQQIVDAQVKVVDLRMRPWDERLAGLHPLALLPGAGKALRTVWEIARALRREKIDVVELHGHVPIILGTLAAILARTRYVVTTYDMHFWDRPFWRTGARMIFLLQKALVTDSQQRATVMNEFLWRRLPTYVIPNGIRAPMPCRSRSEVCRELGIPDDPKIKIVGQVSGINPNKGHHVVVEAARSVLQRYENVVFLFCGYVNPLCPRDFPDRLRAKAAEYGFGDKLFIFGYPGYIGDIWQLIDIHVHGSLEDSSPIAIHEGMSLGKPAVATNEGGIPELIDHQYNGLIVPKNDPAALADALLQLLTDPQTAKRMGANARQRYEERHRPETMARALEKTFLQVAGWLPSGTIPPTIPG